jgi:Domain of unknown function (DUF4328)
MTDELFDSSGEQLLIRRSKLLQRLLIFWLISIVAISVLDILELTGFGIDEIESLTLLSTIVGLSIATLIINIIVIILFAMWIYRAAANIRDAEVAGFEYTPGWSVGWYFIPFANLFKPFAAMRQIWNASRGATEYLDDGNSTLTLWWVFWLITNIANNISLRMSLRTEDPALLQLSVYLGLIGSITSFPLYFAAKKLIEEITDGQGRFLHRNTTV